MAIHDRKYLQNGIDSQRGLQKSVALDFYNLAFSGDWPSPGGGFLTERGEYNSHHVPPAAAAERDKLVGFLMEWFSDWMLRFPCEISAEETAYFLSFEYWISKALVESLLEGEVYIIDLELLDLYTGPADPEWKDAPFRNVRIHGLPEIAREDSYLPLTWPPHNPVVSACARRPQKAVAHQAGCHVSTVARACQGEQKSLPTTLARCVASLLGLPDRVAELDYEIWRNRVTVEYVPPPLFHPGSLPGVGGHYDSWLLQAAASEINAGLVEILRDPRLVKCQLSECGRVVTPTPHGHGQMYCCPEHAKRAAYLGENRPE